MKAILPVAGKGTRLRPHTLTTPKALVKVGGRPVMAYILDDLIELGVDEVVFIVGYLREVIESYVRREYPQLESHFVLQEVQDGTAGAIGLAEPYVDEDVLIVFVDTLFDADLSIASALSDEWSGVIWAKEVEDYQRFGVILTDESGAMTRIVEKPKEPVSKLANIGLYYMRDWQALFGGIQHVLSSPPGPGGEYFLTDAFQHMVDNGRRIRTAPVTGWYDCGKLETVLETNHHLVSTSRRGVSADAEIGGSDLSDDLRIESGARVHDSRIGPNVTIERGAVVEGSTLEHCIVGENTVIEGCTLSSSVIGSDCRIRKLDGTLNAGPFSHLEGLG